MMMMNQAGLCIALTLAVQTGAAIENKAYRVDLRPDGAVEVRSGEARRVFQPEFTILRAERNPAMRIQLAREEIHNVPSWLDAGGARTMDLYRTTAKPEVLRATGAQLRGGNTIEWTFPSSTVGKLEARLTLPDDREPRLEFRFTPSSDAWYSVGYTGAPKTEPSRVDALWQCLVWQERRFPRMAFLSTERQCSLPAAIVQSEGASVAVVADPADVPFRIPSFEDSRFGVLLRSADGKAQPALFAPVLGGPAENGTAFDTTQPERYGSKPRPPIALGPPSRMTAGNPFSFRIRLVVSPRNWYETYRNLATGLYGFRDYRENVTGSLNDTLENMVALGMDDLYSNWNSDLRGFDYTTDVKGTVKVVSALHPLSVALLTDNREVYRRRALPIIEYLMSREKYLLSIAPDIKGQNPSYYLRGPAAEVSELAALHLFSGGRSTVFRHYAETLNQKPRALNLMMVSEPGSWQNELALYRMTGDRAHLDKARAGADRYIAQRVAVPATDMSDVHVPEGGQFWSDFIPKWIDLYELYDETGDRKYLDAAASGARHYATLAWVNPAIPPGQITVNPGDQVGAHGYIHGESLTAGLRAPEQKVAAWRVAHLGLIPEAANTYTGNPFVFLAHHAPYFLRIGAAIDDPFLQALARSAVVGRYLNYPGYDINGEFTTVYERPDYPLRPFRELTYNNIYYNHIWPQIALDYDYLISDVIVRSGGAIAFPSRYAQGYAYLQSKVYGDRPGTFYGDRDVRLWMPAKLLHIDSPQLNYVSGYNDKAFYVALSNQSARPVTARVRIHSALVPLEHGREYRVRTWSAGKPGPAGVLRDGEITIAVPASGLAGFAVDGLRIVPQFQSDVLAPGTPLSGRSFSESETPAGKVTGMLIDFGGPNANAYVWMAATGQQMRSARLHYRLGDQAWRTVDDAQYPYDFSIPLAGATSFTYRIEATPAAAGAATLDTGEITLRK